jgi:ABC-2 type transport system permease protein
VYSRRNAYWELARAGFRRESRYRLAAFAGLFTNVVFGFIKAAILFAAVDSGKLTGYTTASISAYVWVSQGLLGAIQLSGLAEVGERIRTGEVAVDFIRPVDIQGAHLAADLGRATFSLIPRGIPSVLVGALTVGLAMPVSVLPYLLGALSILLGVTISFLGRFSVNLTGFWIVETRGVRTMYMVVSTFLAGLFVPVGLFPPWLAAIANSTPFPSILQGPVDVVTGRVTGLAAVAVVGRQCFWVASTCLVGRLLVRAGRRKLEIQGG